MTMSESYEKYTWSDVEFQNKIIGKEVPAIITGVQSYGFFAEIIDITAEGLVHVSTLGDDWYEYRSRQSRLVGRKSKRIYQLGDVLNVKVIKIDILRRNLILKWA